MRGELRRAGEIAKQLLTLAERTGDDICSVAAHYAVGVTFYWMGKLEDSKRHFSELIRHYRPTQHPTMTSLFGLNPGIVGVSYWSVGG